MTEQSTEAISDHLKVTPAPSSNPAVLALVAKTMEQVVAGKISLSDMFATIATIEDPQVPDKKPPVPKALTDEQMEAIKRLPEVYGTVVVTADRALTPKEQRAIVEERMVLDTLLTVLEKRKSESIREVLANHLDHVLDAEKQATARKDKVGHYAEKQDVPVDGTGMKIQRSVSGGKPNLTMAEIEALHTAGAIDRKTYLAVTKKPDLPRVLDESGLHKAIQKNPALFFLLASVAKPTLPQTTIKVVKDS